MAVAGESLWSKLARPGEDKAYTALVRGFLDANLLRLTAGQEAAFRRRVCEQLQAARKAGLIPGRAGSTAALAKSVAEMARFADPAAMCRAEWQAVAVIATEVRKAGHNDLADLLERRPDPAEPPLLAVAVRFFFRREVETDEPLFRGLVYEQVDRLRQEVCEGLSGLLATLETHGGRLVEVLTVAEETRGTVLDLKAEQARQGAGLQALYAEVLRQGEKLNHLRERGLRASDSLSIRGDTERQLVRQVIAKYRTLGEEQRRQLPALLDAIGKLELAAGEYKDAQRDFEQQAAWVGDSEARAAAHFGAYLAALERQEWDAALTQLREAMRLDPNRWEPFPSGKFAPERILGAGGFGVVFLCRDVDSGARVAVKALRTDELDRDTKTVIAEAEQLEGIEHENIIRLRTAGFADSEKTRPFLVMSYFDGMTLEEYVRGHGCLPTTEAREVARQIAVGLMAAHERNILHRDVKPGNILVKPVAGAPDVGTRWQVKLIDFGLALRRQAVHNTLSNADALARTTRGQSIAGTMDYAAPEQIGKLSGATVGPYSDVYGFGKTLCFAVFGTPQPGPRHWRDLGDEDFGELLGQCIEERPEARPQSLGEVVSRLRGDLARAEREKEETERLRRIEEVERRAKEEGERQARERAMTERATLEPPDYSDVKRDFEEFRALKLQNRNERVFLFPAAPRRIERWRAAAEAGVCEAQCLLGACCANGTGTAKNRQEALRWLRRAAEAGNVVAMQELGWLFKTGKDADSAQAAYWLGKAADAGWPGLMTFLAFMFENGTLGIKQDYTEAFRWLRKAAGAGDGEAMLKIAGMYEEGKGVRKDKAEALRWYHKAWDAGCKMAAMCLFTLTHQPVWMERFMEETPRGADVGAQGEPEETWSDLQDLRQLAQAGSPDDMYLLALRYELGTMGTTKDRYEAVRWLEAAANLGHEDAATELKSLREGDGHVDRVQRELEAQAERERQQKRRAFLKRVVLIGVAILVGALLGGVGGVAAAPLGANIVGTLLGGLLGVIVGWVIVMSIVSIYFQITAGNIPDELPPTLYIGMFAVGAPLGCLGGAIVGWIYGPEYLSWGSSTMLCGILGASLAAVLSGLGTWVFLSRKV